MHTTSIHLGTRSYWGTRVRVLEVMQDKTTSTMQQGICTNYKSLQMHEKKKKHKSMNLKAYKSNIGTKHKSYISKGTKHKKILNS